MDERLIIEGLTEEGKRFRPGDWIERLSSALGSFGRDQRLRYSVYVSPCMIEEEKCLILSRELEQLDPRAYDFVLKFARDNRLRVQPDRRSHPIPVPVDRRAG